MKFRNKQYRSSVHLVVYNGSKYLPYCLERVAQQTDKNFFFLIIDNASIDNSVKIISDFLAINPELATRTRLVKNNKNVGFAKGHNQAWQWTAGDYGLMLNQDVLLEPDYLEQLVNLLQTKPPAAAVQGKILKWEFNSATYRLDLHKNLHKIGIFDSCGLAIKKNRHTFNLRQGEFDQGQAEEQIEVFGVSGTSPLYRRAALDQIKYQQEVLDQDFVSYKEDVDIAWRLRLAGWQAWYQPKAVCYHDRSLSKPEKLSLVTETRSHWPEQMKVYSCRNHWLVLFKNDCWSNLFRHSGYIGWYELKKFLYRLVFETKVLAKATFQCFFLLPIIFKKRAVIQKQRRANCKELRRWFI
ncbi:MAG: glycosyltransferase family 2 protein [Patescibacteria group bacterium]